MELPEPPFSHLFQGPRPGGGVPAGERAQEGEGGRNPFGGDSASLDVTLDLDPGVWVIFELGGEKERKIEEPLDLPFLLPIYGQVIELLKEATRRYEEYNKGLEAFKKRFSSEHSRKILMASL